MTVTVLAWNAHANHPSQAGRVTRALSSWPDTWQAGVLTEVKGARKPLKAWAKRNGCRLIQERSYPRLRADERGDTAVLLRVKGKHAVKPRRDWLAIMAEAWTVFSHRVRHQPRRHRRVVFTLPDGARVRLSGEHWPTRGNRAAWEESYNSARAFLDRPGAALVVGDLNANHQEVWGLADDVGGKVQGAQPDYLVTNRPARIDVEVLGLGGSDHRAFRYKVDG